MKARMSFFALLLGASLSAQEIHFCLSYTVLGEPIRVSNSWNVSGNGGYLYILFKQPEEMQGSIYEMIVSEEKEGGFTEVSRHRIAAEIGKNWIAVYHKFFRAGDFKVAVHKNGLEAASEYLTITQQKTRLFGQKRVKHDPRLLYANTKVVSCQTVKEGKPVNPSAVFSIPKNTNQVTFLILNDKTLSTEKVNVDLYKKSAASGAYSEFVESKRVIVEHNRHNTYFILKFIEPGEYKVYIYDEDQVWINSGYVTINN